MPLASTNAKARLAATKTRQPIASTSASTSASASAHPTAASIRSRVPPSGLAALHDAALSQPQPSRPLQLQLPPPLPTIVDLQTANKIAPSSQVVSARLLSLARSFLAIHPDTGSLDPLDWELDLCTATFFAVYAVCLDPASTLARRTLARCARLGGFNIVLPFAPAGSAASSIVSPSTLSSHDPHDVPGAHACIHILQQGSAATFQDPDSAREYRDANRILGRASDAADVLSILNDKVLGKRKASDTKAELTSTAQPVPAHARFASQLQTDVAHAAYARNRVDEARATFVHAVEQDPFNWRAWAGLCDTGYGSGSASRHLGLSALDRLYSKIVVDVQAPYVSMEAALKSAPAFSAGGHASSSAMVRKVSEDGSNKKFKVSSEAPPVPPLPTNDNRTAPSSAKPTGNLTPPLPTTSASSVTATRLHPPSRALSAAQTNTHHLDPLPSEQDDVKASKVNTVISRPTRNGAVRTATITDGTTTQNGRQLRSTAQRTGPTAAPANVAARARPVSAVQGRAGAISQAGSVSSTSSASSASSMTSRATASTARTAVSTRRAATATTSQPSSRVGLAKSTVPASARSDTAVNGSGAATRRVPTATAARSAPASLSRPGSAMSKASSTSISGPSTAARANGSLASARTAADAMRQKEEETARAKLDELVSLRESCVQRLTALAHQHAADRYILALLAHVGEAYRLLRLCEGDKAAAALMQNVLPSIGAAGQNKNPVVEQRAPTDGQQDDDADELSSITATSKATRLLDLQVKDSLIHHLLLGRSYAESAQYASAETHFAAARKLNPFVASHTDIYSLVLFHLSREVQLSALAQHLVMVAPGTAATHIVVGNAFSLQKEHQTALVCFQRAAAAAPDYAYAYTLAGHEAHDLGLHDEAIAYFRSAIRCDRRHWNAWAGLGRVYLGIGEHEHAACKSLQQAISINPTNHLLWDLVGWTFALVSAPAKALECYNRAIELAPAASVLTYLRRAELLLHQGDVEASHRDLACAHDLAPEEASIHILLAQSYMRLGGGAFCHLETSGGAGQGGVKSGSALRASGVMVLPKAYHAEISHHLSVAVDLDPSLLRVVKSICEGYKNLPGSKLSVHAHDLTAASFTQSHLSADSAGLSHYDASGAESDARHADSNAHHSAYGSFRQHNSLLANSTPQHPQLLVPADFASTHPAAYPDSSSFLSLQTPGSTSDIVLEDADT